MTRRTAVVIPWRPDHSHRSRAWRHLRPRWQAAHPDWDLLEGLFEGEPWIKSHAIGAALARTDAEVLVIADADVWCEGTRRAVEAVEAGDARWAIPHRRVHRLGPLPTRRLLAGRLPWEKIETASLAQRPYTGMPGGGLVVIDRALYEAAPLDPRFRGWGGEDSAAGIAWAALAGKPWRGTDPLWHLWHPPQPRTTRGVGSTESLQLLGRYKLKRGNADAIKAIIAEHLGGDG
jgi:hypothetical protein